jgi:hypothetical protein
MQKFQQRVDTESMSAKRTPGQVLVEALTRELPQQLEFDESELATLDLISHAADRLDAVRRRFDARVVDPACSDSQLASLQTAIHQLEGDIFRGTKSLNLGAVQAKSLRHQHAANVRWSRDAS